MFHVVKQSCILGFMTSSAAPGSEARTGAEAGTDPGAGAGADAGTGALARAEADPVTGEVVDLIGTVVARYHAEYELAASHLSLTGAQAKVLALLSREPTPMRVLANQLHCEPSNVTGIVDRLESRGLVERRPDPADRRIKLAAATDDGRSTADSLRASLDFAREPLAGLTSLERALLRDLLRRMLGEETDDA
jgi:DNA-binding MarR family transcriptional regulator